MMELTPFAPGDFARIRDPSGHVPAFAQDSLCAVIGPASEDVPPEHRASFRRVVIVRRCSVSEDHALEISSFIANAHVSILAPIDDDESEWLEASVLREVLRAMRERLLMQSPGHA